MAKTPPAPRNIAGPDCAVCKRNRRDCSHPWGHAFDKWPRRAKEALRAAVPNTLPIAGS